ncbi:MAG: choice-of-anchor D domain-containing protein [Candidatus Sulfotelmatobacter sp.]
MGRLPTRWNSILIILALTSMVGCQGFSSAKPNSQGAPQAPLPGALSAAPASVSFGNVQIGTSQTESETLSNTGGSTITLTQVVATGVGLSTTGLSLPLTLAAGQSATFSVVFTPQAAGIVSGSLALTNDGSNSPLNVAISGTGVAAGSLAENPTSFSFGNVQTGASQTQTETLKNTGGENLTISQAIINAGFSYSGLSLPITLAPNQSATFGVVFAPTAAGSFNGLLSLTVSGSSATVDMALSGIGVTPATLTASPASLSFTGVQAGKTETQTESVQNTGGVSATISQGSVAGTGFSISGLSTPVTLAPGQSTSFNVSFAPASSGTFTGSVAIASNASDSNLNITLSGSATGPTQGQLAVVPTTINVGNVTVGTSGTQTAALSATGSSVTVSSISLGGSEFSISGLSFPVTLAAGQSVNFNVTFTPQASGLASVSASFASNASNSPTAATVTGTGVAAPVHSVNLSWTGSNSPEVVGYNIYRRSGAGGNFTQINGVLNATTAYTDTSVADGQTYYYETTAVNSSNEESGPSSPPVQAVIPPP